jgi:outer membrane protein insertion porin family
MRFLKTATLSLLLSLLAIAALYPSENTYEGETIIDIRFEGLIQNDEASVKSVLTSKVRSGFSLDAIDQDIKSLYNLDLFKNIEVDVKRTEGGVVVTYILTELPIIRDVIIKGNKKVSRVVIKDEILLSKGSVFREEDVYYDIQSIKDLYEEKGFPSTKVEYKVVPSDEIDKETGEKKNRVDLVFTITESKRLVVKMKSIFFSGNENVRKDKLLSIMKTKYEGYWLASGFFQEDVFEQDKLEILRHYGELGYIDAEIVKVDKKIEFNETRNRDEMEITIYINEGDQYRFGGVTITGNEIFNDDELYSLFTLKKGSFFNRNEWEMNLQAVRNLLASNGYIYFNLDVKEKKNKEQKTLSYDISLKENNKAHIEHIFITGNTKTKKFVIERELEVYDGEIFSSTKIQRSREKLFNLQFFSAVNVDVKQGSEFGLVDLIFNVEDQRTGLFSFGMSYSTAGYGIALFEEMAETNFLGRGLRLHERVEIGLTRQSLEVGIDEPWLFNTPTSVGLTLSASRIEYGTIAGDYVYIDDNHDGVPDGAVEIEPGIYDYTNAETMTYVNTSYLAAVRLGRRFEKYYGVNAEFGLSIYQNVPTEDHIPYEDSLWNNYNDGWPWYYKNYLSLTGYRDTRDYKYFATKGTYIAQTVWFFGGILGGDSHFIKLNTDMNVNFKTFWKFVLSMRVNFGFILPYPDRELWIDDSDYIRVDCMNEGRGWQNYSQWGSLYSRRGKSEFNFSLEYRFPIEERIIWGLAFFDASGIFDDAAYFTIDPRELYYSIGLGISFVIPNFPIRLYLARRFKYDDVAGEVQLANSQMFFKNWDFVFSIAGFF